MKSFKILTALFFLSLSLLNAEIKYSEDFSSSVKNDWSVSDDENLSAKILDGFYNIEHKRNDGSWNVWKSFPVYYEKDFTIESQITQKGGVENYGYGILWGAADSKNEYVFSVASLGQFCIFKFDDGKYINIKSWTISDKINKLNIPNNLKIVQKKKHIYFYINNSMVWDTTGLPDFGNYIGFNLQSKMNIAVDFIKVSYDTAKINLPDIVQENISKESLGKNVNTPYEELMPVISADGKSIFYSIRNHPDNIGDTKADDIWTSKIDEDGYWSKSVKMEHPLNNDGYNSIVSVTPDGNTMVVLNTYTSDGYHLNGPGVSITQRKDKGWEVPKKIDIIDFYNRNEYSEFCINADKNVLFMTIQRDDSYGGKDIYISFKNGDKFTKPRNLGPIINTMRTEISPFLASDNATLYFSSHGHPGYGNADVFMTKRLDSTWLNWSEPINLGKGLNTVHWDAYYTIPASGEYAYFISNETSDGSSDLFRMKLPDAAKPNPVILVYGKVLDTKTKLPISTEIFYNELKNDKSAGSAQSDPKTGNYKIVLPYGKAYSFLAQKKGYYSISDNLDATSINKYMEIERDLYLTPIEVGEKIRLNNIFFAYDKSDLQSDSYPELNRLISFLKEYPEMKVEIGGHTDNMGNQSYNLKLSNDRANAVMNYLTSNGIKTKRVTAKGYGKLQPVASNDTDEGRQLNRRVEFVIINK